MWECCKEGVESLSGLSRVQEQSLMGGLQREGRRKNSTNQTMELVCTAPAWTCSGLWAPGACFSIIQRGKGRASPVHRGLDAGSLAAPATTLSSQGPGVFICQVRGSGWGTW